MESFSHDGRVGSAPSDELEHLEQAAADPTIAAMPVPHWVWPVVAVLGSLFAFAQTLEGASGISLTGLTLFSFFLLLSRLASRHGAVPSPLHQPRRLNLLRLRWAFETIVLVLALMYLGWKVNKWLAIAIAGPAWALISYLHDARAEAATAEMRGERDR